MNLRQAMIKSGAVKLTNTKHKRTKHKPTRSYKNGRSDNLVPYRELQDYYVFRRFIYGEGYRIFTKISDAYAIDDRTGKDSIFLHHELVEPLYPALVDRIG